MDKHKDYNVAFWLSIFLGIWGVDRFYIGDIGLGLLKLFTGGGFLVWWVVDIFKMRDLKIEQDKVIKAQKRIAEIKTNPRHKRSFDLAEKYGTNIARRIIQKQPVVGDSEEIIRDMFEGVYFDIRNIEDQSYTFSIYHKKGTNEFELEIDIKNGFVTGIKDQRKNRRKNK